MGETPSREWSPEWILDESNVEIKRILIQTIGYGRILTHFPHRVIDTDGDMQLVAIEREIDVAPIHLLKLVCPSTGAIYTHRVDPVVTACEVARASMWGFEKIDWIAET
jgi:hypothetical protein